MIGLLLIAGWGLGLLSAPHCLLACGPLVIRQQKLTWRQLAGYHLLRWFGYSLTLLIIGRLFGRWPQFSVLLSLIGALYLVWWTFMRPAKGTCAGACQSSGRRGWNSAGFWHGLLPCPMIWAMASLGNRLSGVEILAYTGGFVGASALPLVALAWSGDHIFKFLRLKGWYRQGWLKAISVVMPLWLVYRSVWPLWPHELPLRGNPQCVSNSYSVLSKP